MIHLKISCIVTINLKIVMPLNIPLPQSMETLTDALLYPNMSVSQRQRKTEIDIEIEMEMERGRELMNLFLKYNYLLAGHSGSRL